MKKSNFILILFIPLCISYSLLAFANNYLWLPAYDPKETILNRITPPPGYARLPVKQNSFQAWLRHLPVKPGKPDVYLYNGKPKTNQNAHFIVIDIDTGNQDLQQCADAIIRLRAEYLYSIANFSTIHFNFTSGDTAHYKHWKQGFRPNIKNNKVTWRKSTSPNQSYSSFKQYLKSVFTYAGSFSLNKELKKVLSSSDIRAGDVFIQGGFPGHAIIVIDVAKHNTTGEKIFLLGQSYMPAQDIHILHNPNSTLLSPWYSINFSNKLVTPEWIFNSHNLKRFDQSN